MSLAKDSTGIVADVFAPFAFFFAGSALVLASTPAKSLARLGLLPFNVALVLRILLRVSDHVRMFWARGTGAFATGMLLQYIDIALISAWSFEQNPRHRPGSNTRDDAFVQRFKWGFLALFDSRRLNTPAEVKGQQAFPDYALRSRSSLILFELRRLTFFYILTDILTPYPPPDAEMQAAFFGLDKMPIFTRLLSGGGIALSELGIRTVLSVIYWFYSFTCMEVVLALANIISVLSGICQPTDFKYFFGSVSDSYNLRGWWGKTWHQSLRHPFGKPGEWLVEDVLGIRKTKNDSRFKSWTVKYTKLALTFAVSGVFHVAGDVATGDRDLWNSGTMRYFLLQAFGILIEDHVQSLCRVVSPSDQRPRTWMYVLGYVWTLAFMTWTTPVWIFPAMMKVDPSGVQPFLPFSFVRLYFTGRPQ